MSIFTKKNKKREHFLEKKIAYIVWLITVTIIIVPFLLAFSLSLKDSYTFSIHPFIPENPTLKTYLFVFNETSFPRWMFNSIVISGVTTFLKLFMDSLAGYAFAKKDFPGKDILFLVLLSSMMIPFSVLLIPSFLLVKYLNMVNTYAGLILPSLGFPMGIFLMRQFMQTIPSELEDAARIDGASEFQIYSKIIIPISRSALVVLAIYTFMTQWTNFLWPLVITTTDYMRTIPVGLATLQGLYSVNWGQLMAAALLSIIPITTVFLFFQRYFIEGLTAGAIKG